MGGYDELLSRIKILEKQRDDAENMLEYERNKFARIMQSRESGIAEQIADDIELELNAIAETAEFLEDLNKRRILKRVKQIHEILSDYHEV